MTATAGTARLAPGSTVSGDLDRLALQGMASGRIGALDELYERYRVLAYSIALPITKDPAAAEDAVQEAFLSLWRNADRYVESRGSVKSWLLSIVHNRAIDAIRRRRPTTNWPDAEFVHPAQLVAPDPWREVAGRLDAAGVRHAMTTLPPVQREAIELAFFAGLKQTEVAARTGAPLGTVKSRIRIGLRAMRRSYELSEHAPSFRE